VKKAWLFLLSALLLALCACSGGESPAASPSPAGTPSPSVSPSPAETPPAGAPAPSSPAPEPFAVSDLINETGVYEDSVGNRTTYVYTLPHIDGGSAYADTVNDEMQALYETYIEPEFENMEGGYSLVTMEVGYDVYRNADVTSLFIHLYNDWGTSLYWCYNFTPDGGEVTNRELLTLAGMTEEDFTDAARGILTEATAWRDAPAEMNDELERVRRLTLAEDNCNAAMPMFLNDDGCLAFIARVYSVAGADYYYHVYSIQ